MTAFDKDPRFAAVLGDSKATRRDFIRYASAFGVGAAAASAAWDNRALAATPKKGGNFRVGLHDANTVDTHDPSKYQAVGEICVAHTHRSYLTEVTTENTLGPDMAVSWEASPDAKVWTFGLNKNASFHNGRKFTAKDAIASLNYHRKEETGSAAKPLVQNITDIKADGDHTVVVELDQGIADFKWFMTDYHLPMLPAKDGMNDAVEWESGVGAGPYKIVEREPGVRITFERHGGWHRSGNGAYFDAVDMTVINDPNARQSALVTGSVDSITNVDLKTLSLLKRDSNIEVDNVPSGSAITLPMFCDVDPFKDVNVRLALKYAIDRDEIVQKIQFGAGTPGDDYHVSAGMPYYPDLPRRPYDPEKAKFHLKKAGMSSLNVELSAADSVHSGAVDLVTLYAEHAKPAGINIKPVREASDGYWSDVWLVKPFVFVKWGARPTPDQMFTIAYKDDADWNEAHWQNEQFNKLLLLAKKELDDGRRAQMYREMCQIAKDDGGTVIPLFTNFVYARRKNVRHTGALASAWEFDGARAAHRWWFA